MTRNIDQKPLRTEQERMVGAEIEKIFNESADAVETRLENFPKYVRRQHLTRFLAHYEIFKRIMRVKGSIVECGVNRGYGLMTWAKLSALLEPTNLTRRIYGFDTFAGFPSVSDKDRAGPAWETARPGALSADSYAELLRLIELNDKDRFLGTSGYTEEGFAAMERALSLDHDIVRRAVKIAGLKVVFGTDAVAGAHGRNAEEFIDRVRDAGVEPMSAMISAHSLAADGMRLGDRIGSIAPGYEADIIALEGDPLKDITAVRRVTFVMKGGAVYKNVARGVIPSYSSNER